LGRHADLELALGSELEVVALVVVLAACKHHRLIVAHRLHTETLVFHHFAFDDAIVAHDEDFSAIRKLQRLETCVDLQFLVGQELLLVALFWDRNALVCGRIEILGLDHDVNLVVVGLHEPHGHITHFLHFVAPGLCQEVLDAGLHVVAPHFNLNLLGELGEEVDCDALLGGQKGGLVVLDCGLLELHVVRVGLYALGQVDYGLLGALQDAAAVVGVVRAGLDVDILGGYCELYVESRDLLGLVEHPLPRHFSRGVHPSRKLDFV